MWKLIFFYVSFNTLGRLPRPILYRFMDVAMALAYAFARKSRENVWANLRQVMPPETPDAEIRRVAKRVFRNVGYYYADLGCMPRLDPERLLTHEFDFHGLDEYLRPAIAEGKGVIMMTAHCGNPELISQPLPHLGIHVLALTEPLRPRALSRLFDGHRSSHGITFVPVSVGNVKRVIKTLRDGGVVALLADRDIHGPKEKLPFFGRETSMPTGPMEVAIRTGAAVLPCFTARVGHYHMKGYVEPPLELERTGDFQQDVRKGALLFLERLEQHLRSDPSQWAVLESVWDADETVVETKETIAETT